MRDPNDPETLLSRCAAFLPFAHLPGVSTEAAVARAAAQFTAAAARPDASVLLCANDALPSALALLEPAPWDAAVLARRAGRASMLQIDPQAPRSAHVSALRAHFTESPFDFIDIAPHLSDAPAIDTAIAAGCSLVAVNIGLLWQLDRLPGEALPAASAIRAAHPDDAAQLGPLAARAIDVHSRFARDPQIGEALAAQVFTAWAENLLRGRATLLHVAEEGGRLIGYCAWRVVDALVPHGGPAVPSLELCAIAPEARRRGLMRSLIRAGLLHFQAQGFGLAEVYTNALNGGMQRACVLEGAHTRTARASLHWHRPQGDRL